MPRVTEGSRGLWKETGGNSLGSEACVALSIGGPGMVKARFQIRWHTCELREENPGHRVLSCYKASPSLCVASAKQSSETCRSLCPGALEVQ